MTPSVIIVRDLRMSTKKRLKLVAKLIESEPEHFNMGSWARKVTDQRDRWNEPVSIDLKPLEIAGNPNKIIDCGTSCCAAGWAVTVMPIEEVEALIPEGSDFNWENIGAVGLGLDDKLAARLFGATSLNAPTVINILRKLATVAEPRTLADAEALGVLDEYGCWVTIDD